MTQLKYRINLSAVSFPFLSDLSGRTVMVKGIDQNYVPQIVSSADSDKDVGVPSLYYCHNIIATAQGYESIGYLGITAAVGAVVDFVDIFPVIEQASGNKAYLGVTASGDVYYCSDPYYVWVLAASYPAIAGKVLTTGYVNGVTYIYAAGVGCYKFDFGTHLLAVVVLTSLVAANVFGIAGVAGYLIAWTKSVVAWSSLIDPTDFTPSDITGAGSGTPQGIRGDIVACIAHTTGFIVYTNQNAVSAPASGNAKFPFNFRELVGSGGLASINLVTYDSDSGNHYTYTSSGLQLITLQNTQTVFPELTDFIAGSVFEDFDEVTEILSRTHLSSPMLKKLSIISDRYLVISYGILEYTHALIYDISLKRWGKLKFTHVECFEFHLITAESVETPRRSIALMQNTGAISVVLIDNLNSSANGIALLGKFQYVRTRMMQLHTVEVENVVAGSTFRLVDWYTLDGKNRLVKEATQTYSNGELRAYGFNVVGKNHSLLFKGAYHLCSVELCFSNHGRR